MGKTKKYLLLFLVACVFLYVLFNVLLPDDVEFAALNALDNSKSQLNEIYGENYSLTFKRWTFSSDSHLGGRSFSLYYKIIGEKKRGLVVVSIIKKDNDCIVSAISTWESKIIFNPPERNKLEVGNKECNIDPQNLH